MSGVDPDGVREFLAEAEEILESIAEGLLELDRTNESLHKN